MILTERRALLTIIFILLIRDLMDGEKYFYQNPATLPPSNSTAGKRVSTAALAVELTPLPTMSPTDTPQFSSRTSLSDLDPAKHHWYLGVCSSTAISSTWLQEWLELQLLSGIGHVWVINDNLPGVDDRTGEILKIYEDRGFVTVMEGLPKYHAGCGKVPNCIAPKTCYELVHEYVDQFIFADTDEFIYPTMGCDLTSHVRDHCDQNEAYHTIRWERFGTSGHVEHPAGLMIENFLSSGGDCASHTANDHNCEKRYWDFCLECRHMKSMYNTKCVGVEHVGHPHLPTNTSRYKKRRAEALPDAIFQDGLESVWHHEKCKETIWDNDRRQCHLYAQLGGGSSHPPTPSSDCCVAGIGYNHYGTKSLSHWEYKLNARIRRGFKPENFAVVEQNTTISSNVLRFVRAMRERFASLGLEVAKQIRFYDHKTDLGSEHSTYMEYGYKYKASEEAGTAEVTIPESHSEENCSTVCWGVVYGKNNTRCGGWSFHKQDRVCILIQSHKNSFKESRNLGYERWPHSSFVAQRYQDAAYVSGIPLREGECLLPEHLRQNRKKTERP
eukprot:TRINITY_DN2235_c0_g1_i3.p1 TRINITY_DN2235_c0_g1~~TRINITY_DN2235_c0_g1_i3.p1  ORF type:complete len:577 (+),score=90.60 TRINITY_DN2235_c0_g1_i3:65-1732(+)